METFQRSVACKERVLKCAYNFHKTPLLFETVEIIFTNFGGRISFQHKDCPNLPNQMTEIVKQMDAISTLVKGFKKEQEHIILHSINDMKYSKSAKVKLPAPQATKQEIEQNNEQNLTKIMNVECVLMPHPANSESYQKLWPLSLVANKNTKLVKFRRALSTFTLHILSPLFLLLF